jgi:prolyl-tRNA synthetase
MLFMLFICSRFAGKVSSNFIGKGSEKDRDFSLLLAFFSSSLIANNSFFINDNLSLSYRVLKGIKVVMAKQKNAISPTREEDYSEWYLQVIKAADFAEHSPVRGCMVIKPWGYGIWENIQRIFNGFLKKRGCPNGYFPLFIPLSFLQKEADHVEGFAKECAVVTHHRLEKDPKSQKLVPAGPLEEPLIVRPTSEMIIGEMFSKWIESYRDLPYRINQWANIVRWEMRTRLFLRTTEFLWQEGHTVHQTKEEALKETLEMLDVYEALCKEYLAMPVIKGEKTALERFPGAEKTFSIEALMQDRKALQAGTSHFLGQNFAKSSNITFSDEKGDLQYGWTTSWGVTTRLIGGVIMTHSDDDGAILPPRIASSQIVILPVIHDENSKERVFSYCQKLKEELEKLVYHNQELSVILDDRELRGGEKKWAWVKKGIPLRIEIGEKEIEKEEVSISFRNQPAQNRESLPKGLFLQKVCSLLDQMHDELYEKAYLFLKGNIRPIRTKEEFVSYFTPKNTEKPEIHGGFAECFWEGTDTDEEKIKEEMGVTIRSIPLEKSNEEGTCFFTGKKTRRKVLFAKAY